MALLLYSDDDDPERWRKALARHLPDLDLRAWPELGRAEDIRAALVWLPPPGLLAALPSLQAVFSMAAGVDSLLADETLPPVPICRLVDPSLTRSMGEYVLTVALGYHRQLDLYAADQRAKVWNLRLPRPAEATTVGILGLGELGQEAARRLVEAGFAVRGWSRTVKKVDGVEAFAGPDGLAPFLSATDILVCLLPLTPATAGILDARLFAQLPPGARLINAGRGGHLVEADLLDALATGRLAHATLDVFATEPLPAGHPFWAHPQVAITPHSASYGQPESAAAGIAANYAALLAGRPLRHVVDRTRGY